MCKRRVSPRAFSMMYKYKIWMLSNSFTMKIASRMLFYTFSLREDDYRNRVMVFARRKCREFIISFMVSEEREQIVMLCTVVGFGNVVSPRSVSKVIVDSLSHETIFFIPEHREPHVMKTIFVIVGREDSYERGVRGDYMLLTNLR